MNEDDQRRLRRIDKRTEMIFSMALIVAFFWFIDWIEHDLMTRYGWSKGFSAAVAVVLGIAGAVVIVRASERD